MTPILAVLLVAAVARALWERWRHFLRIRYLETNAAAWAKHAAGLQRSLRDAEPPRDVRGRFTKRSVTPATD